MDDFVNIRTFTQRFEAELAKGLLSEQGIESFILADDCGGQRPDLSVRMGAVQLMIREEDLEEAKEALEILEKELVIDD